MPPQREPLLALTPARRLLLVRLLAAGLGLVAGLGLLEALWPRVTPQRALEDGQGGSPAALADPPNRPITVLLIGSDADRRGSLRNGAAPPGPANADALVLVHVAPKGPLQVLPLPVEAAVALPGQTRSVALGSLYARGGAALVADVAAELVGLPKGQPDRYVVVPRGTLRDLVDGLGRVEISPDRSMRYRDRAQNLTIDIQGGLQMFDGHQLERLLRFKDTDRGEEARRDRQQMALEALVLQMGQRQQLPGLPALVGRLQNQVETNLSQGEALSLLAVGLQPERRIQFSQLPLEPPRPDQKGLRQLARTYGRWSWPQP